MLRTQAGALQCFCSQNYIKCFLDTLIQESFFYIKKINSFQGELVDISSKKEALVLCQERVLVRERLDLTSVANFAEILLRSARKVFIFMIKEYASIRSKCPVKNHLIMKKNSLALTCRVITR